MFKLNGTEYSLEEVTSAAESSNLSVDEYVNEFGLETVEVTDEIQTPVTEGKTNGAVAKGATATPVTGQAPESTESEPDDILSGLEEIKDVREIDKRIKLIAGDDMQVDPLDSTKRITQYKELINRRNNIIGDTYKLGQTQQYQQLDFDPMSPAKIPLEKEGAPEGGVKLAYVPFTVDGEVVGTTMEPVGLRDVVVTAEQYKERENQIQSEAYKNFLEQSGLSTEPLSREEFEAEKAKEGDITEIKTMPYRGLDPIQAFENIGTMLSSFQQTAQEKENYRLQYENYLKKLGNLDPDVKRKLPGFFESTLGSTANMFLQVGGVDDRALYNLSFIMSTVPDDVYANVFGKDLGADLKKEAIKGFSNINEKINSLNSLTSDTVGITDVGEAEGVLGKTGALVGGAYNAITSFAASYVTNVATAGVGLASDMIANSVKDFNDKKAQSLGLTTEELITSNQSEILTPGFLGMLGYSLERFGMEKVGNFITTGLSQGRAKALVNLAFAAGGEGTTEYLQGLVETFNSSLGEGLSTEDAVDKVKEQLTSKESLERFLQGAVGGSGIALGGQGLKAVSALRSPAENKKLTKIINQLSELENSKFRKNLTADQIGEINTAQEELRFNLKNIVDNNNELISTLTKQQIETLNSNADFLTTSASKINEIQNSEAYTEQDKEVLINAVNQQRELASQNIFNIRNEAEKLQSQIEKVKGLTGLVKGLNIEEADTAADAEKFAEDNNLDIKSSTSQGYILQNPETGEQTIVINKETALNEQAVNVAGHEFLHAILFKTVKDSPQTAINLGNALLSELNKIDVNKIKDSNFKKRMEQYNDQSREVKMEEALTLFSDALATGDISFKENSFTKLGDRVRRVAQKFGLNIKFNTGRDVYNFIKDYNRSIEKGDLSLAQVQAAAKGVEGELVAPTEQQADELIVKEARSDEASQRVQEIYEQQGEAGTFEIIEQFKPITSKIVERRSEAPGFDRQLLTDEIETGKRGIIDLIKEYDPESGVPLAAYINKFLPARAIEASKRVLGEEFTEDVTEARGVAAEEVVTETAIKPEAKAIDPFRIMPNVREAAVAEVQKSIADKDVDVTEVTYKELKDVAPYQTVADFFNIPVSRIKNPKDNLRKSDDVANIQRWILKNEPTLKNLFTEANRDVIEVTEGNRVIRQGGEPTAIPRNLLNKFYTKGNRVGNNFQWKLKPYDRTTFLEAVGIKDGKVDPNFTPRAAEAQTIKGILDMYTRNLGNVAARDIIEGREDIAPAERARVQAEVAKGKPRIMLSKAAKQAAVDEINQFIEKQEFVKTGDELAAENKVWKFIAKQLGVTPISSKNADDVVEFQQWVRDVLAPRIDKSFFTTGTFANAGTSAAKRNFYFTSAQELNDLLEGVQFGPESKSIQQAVNRKTYVTGGAEGVVSKKFVKEFNSSEFKKEQQEKLDGLKEVFTVFQELMQEDSNNAKFVIALLTSTSQGMGHFVRTSAPVKFYSKNIEGGIVEEHTMPASLVAKYLFGQAVNGTIDQGFKPIENNYFQGALGKNDDKKLKGKKPDGKPFNYTSMTPEGWTLNDNIWARYFNVNVATNNFGIDPNNIVLSTGKTVFETYGVNNSGGLVSNNFNTEQQKAAQINNNKVPKNFRVMSSKSMPNVLDNMSNLDADAKQANKEFYDSVDLNKQFNDILEVKTGIASEKRYKRVKAEVVGANKGRFQFFIPPSAEDFTGLLYPTLAKGKLGDAQMAWYKKNLLDPYAKAMNELSSARIAMMNDYKALKKELKLVPKDLRKKIPGEPFTQEQAVRVYIWQKQGMSVPGISEADMQDLSDFVEGKEDLKTFADQLMYIQKGDQYAAPKEGWPAGTITTDMLEGLNTTKRAKALEQWRANADEIFSEENLNKLEAAYGKPYRKAMENMLQRMKSGRNRNFQGDTLTGRFTDWVTGSIGTIMFFNTRSAILQTISSINFINFTDNNVLAAGKAFANQKQYWSDFMTLMNSDFLKERRGGLRINVSEADIADMAKKGGARGVINKLLEFGFTPTQIADSFAIASGGSAFYRNRIKSLKKQGMTDAEAEAQAFIDFRETAEESQQSSRPDRISMQQAGPLGRFVLAFANTPAQYARLIKKATSDLKNGRGDAKTNISKIIYYGVAQNLLFNALQQALFAFAFDDDEEDTDEQKKKYVGIANGMMDSLLRGMGIGGAAVSVGKNAIIRIINEMEKKQPKLEKVGYEITKLSPPISAKLSRINQAARSYQWDKKEMKEKGWSLDNPAYLAGANVVAALTNVPLDRAIKKTNNVVTATSQDLETWERLALLGGWQDWEIGIDEEKPSNKPQPRKSKSSERKTIKRKTTTR